MEHQVKKVVEPRLFDSSIFEKVRQAHDYAILSLDLDGNIVSWNESARRLTGHDGEGVIGKHASILYTEQDNRSNKPACDLKSAIQYGQHHDEGWRLRKDGTRFWADVAVTALYDKSKNLTGFTCVIRDLSAVADVEEALRRTEELSRLMVAAVKDYAIFMLDPQGNVLTWNAGAQRINGYTAKDIIGQNFRRFYPPEALANDHPGDELEKARKNGHYEEEGWRLRKDGTRFWASVTITPVWDEQNELRGFVKVTRDLTERKLAQESLEAARDAAVEANRLKSEFVATVSHEIRTPMAGVIGMAEQLATDEALTAEQHDIAEHLHTASRRLLEVLNDLLDFSKLEAGRVTLEDVRFSLRSLVCEVESSIKPPAASKHLDLKVLVAPEIPEYLTGDEAKVRQVLLNLAHNAVKFTAEGAIKIKVEIVETHNPQLVVRFAVSDTGTGVREEAKARLFEPFVQADRTTRRRFGGTGLGLSISKRYVELMGCKIGFDSEFGKGSTFWFTVPLKLDAA